MSVQRVLRDILLVSFGVALIGSVMYLLPKEVMENLLQGIADPFFSFRSR